MRTTGVADRAPTEAGSSGASRVGGVGVVPSFPPEDDSDLCGEAEGSVDYTRASSGRNGYHKSAILVPRGGCSFERKALSAQRLGADAVVNYPQTILVATTETTAPKP